MAKLSLTEAWNEAAAFVKREARLLFPIALLFVALPMTAVRLLMPPEAPPGQLPEAGAWMAALPAAIIVGMIGNIAIATLALRPGTSVGEALANGLRRMPVLLGTTLLIGIASAAVGLAVVTLVAILFGGGAAPSQQGAVRVVLVALVVLLPLAFYVFARLVATTPAAAAERVGPIGLIRRSWSLTASSAWTLVGFLLLVSVLFVVISVAAGAVLGILFIAAAGPPEPGSASAILILIADALINSVIAVYMTVMVARIYAQLSGSAPASAPTKGS